jgi:hypothetical protein
MGNSPADRANSHFERLMAKADADRAARLAGHKSLFRRMRDVVRRIALALLQVARHFGLSASDCDSPAFAAGGVRKPV